MGEKGKDTLVFKLSFLSHLVRLSRKAAGEPRRCCIMQADAPHAYCQTELLGTETWVCLPPEARPEAWNGMKWPVVQLKKTLYGHHVSGTYWEQHCDRIVREAGWVPLPPEWPSCYFHKELEMFLIIYVDDKPFPQYSVASLVLSSIIVCRVAAVGSSLCL